MILGITGKCGVGKQTAAHFFEQRGWHLIDVDKTAHKLYRPYLRVWKDVVERFGEGILKSNDVIDRQKLRMIVFGTTPDSKKALQDLNDIVHPELKRYLKDEVYFLKKRKKNTVVLGALWQEVDMFDLCDKVLLIKAGDALGYDRVKKRDGMDLAMYEQVCLNQKDPTNAHFEVVNEGDIQSLYKQLNAILPQL